MYRLLLTLIFALILSSCVSDSISIRPAPEQIVGTYFYGGYIGPGEVLVLHSNGTFDSSVAGDLITTPVGSGGTWMLDGDRITFRDAGLALGEKPYHTFALTQTYKGQLVLVPGKYADDWTVDRDFIYKKQPEK